MRFDIAVSTMPTAGFAAIATLFVFYPCEDDVSRCGVAVVEIASCAGFGVEMIAKGFVVKVCGVVCGHIFADVVQEVLQNYG